VSPVKYELGFYIPADGSLHSHRRENLKSYIRITSSPPDLGAVTNCRIETRNAFKMFV
jgi:hypothetical protein